MNNKEKMALVPKLRFPKFRDSGEWDEKKLGEVISYKKGFAFNSKDFTSSGISIIKISDTQGAIIKDNLESFIDINLLSDMNNLTDLKEDDVIITTVGSKPPMYNSMVGRCIVVSSKYGGALLNQNLVRLRGQEKVLNQKFLSAILKTRKFTSFVESIIRGNANQGSISLNDLFKFKDCIPFLPEQQKIADCLSSLDDLLTAEDKKLHTLKTHKKGLMQNLFPAEGKTVPKLRFPEFRDSGEWEEKKLGDVCEVVGGGTPDTNIEEYWGGDILWYTPTEIKSKKYVNSSNRKITELGLKNSSAKLLPINTILITSRATIGDMAILTEPATTNQGFQSLIVDNTNSIEYIYYLQHIIKKELFRLASGSTFLEINKNSIKTIQIPLPCLEEQQKIANCLSELDKLITAQAEKIGTLKLHKKGLMQGLFVGGDGENE